MNSIWNNNIQAFCSRFPGLAQMFSEIISQPDEIWKQANTFWQISTAKNGMPTASENTIHLHSTYNPEREAVGAVNLPEIQKKSTTIFMGFGLGYHVIEWAKQNSNKALKLIEPDPVHFFAAMMVLDWTPVFQIENLVIAVACPAENVISLLEDQTKINIGDSGVSDSYIFNIPAFTAHAQDYFGIVKTLIDRNKTKNEINAATLKKFGKLWERNCNKNKWVFENCENKKSNEIQTSEESILISSSIEKTFTSSIRNRKDRWVLVAAGPTLQNLIPQIAQMQKECVVICVETALHTLLRAGLQPDYIILMDPQYWAYKHIAGLHAPDSILVTEISAYPGVFYFDCKQIFLCKSQIPAGTEIEKTAGVDLVDLGAGGSVASAAWNFAKLGGAKQVYLAGLDLGYPGKQTHVRGSSAEQNFHVRANRITPVEKMNAAALHSVGTETSKDYSGKPIQTDARMKMFAWWFESRIANCSDVKTYTLSSESLKIPGVLEV